MRIIKFVGKKKICWPKNEFKGLYFHFCAGEMAQQLRPGTAVTQNMNFCKHPCWRAPNCAYNTNSLLTSLGNAFSCTYFHIQKHSST